MKDTKHLWRVSLLILFGIVAFAVGRLFFVPKTFGDFGHYRASNVDEQRAPEVRHQGAESCEPCHSEEFELWKAGGHKPINCENCHAPVVNHVKEGEKFADMNIDKTATFCLRCHQIMPARPADFPQVNALDHLAERNRSLSDTVCFECHSPHDPTPKDTVAAVTGTSAKEK